MKCTTVAAFLTAAFAAAALACSANGSTPRLATPQALDDILFRQAVLELQLDNDRGALRIDPRAVQPNPEIATLRFLDVMPDRITPIHQADLLYGDANVVALRRKILAELRIPETDAFADLACPGILVRNIGEVRAIKAAYCPMTSYRSVMIALPRRGGEYWPSNVDSVDYGGRDIMTVRTFSTSVGRAGTSTMSTDLVFEKKKAGRWRLLHREDLLIVE